MTSAMLQRICLSGPITELSEANFALVKEGIRVYKQIRSDIPDAVPFYPLGIPKIGDGIICVAFRYKQCIRMAVWCFNENSKRVEIPLECSAAKLLYPLELSVETHKKEGGVAVKFPAAYTSAIIEID